jgi:RND family efflux transporter, MFP subunit
MLALVVGAVSAYKYFPGSGPKGPPPVAPMTVKAREATIDTVSVYIHALGTVTPPRTVTVRSRVDGELIALHFTEGRKVEAGDSLAEIDPRPYEVQKAQAMGALARDEALLRDARLDLERYRRLIKEQSISQQQLQSQEAVVGQYAGAVIAGRAAVADAELQLTYSRITAPVSGRVGLRRVDVGNIVRSSDADGIVVITQMQPMEVIFTLVEKQIPDVLASLRKGGMWVEAWGQENTRQLATGVLRSLDNQIDTATGTVRAKAEFDNVDEMLFPNQFVNIHLHVRDLENVLTIPTSAVQRNINGFFVYVVEEGRTHMREIKSSYATDLVTVVDVGLREGDLVVTDGVDRLREGSLVTIWQPDTGGTIPADKNGTEFGSEGPGGTGVMVAGGKPLEHALPDPEFGAKDAASGREGESAEKRPLEELSAPVVSRYSLPARLVVAADHSPTS